MELRIKNQLPGTVDFCIGMNEYQLEPEQDIIVPVEDGDCMYLDQMVKTKTPASKAFAAIESAMDDYRAGKLNRAEVMTAIRVAVKDYLDTEPIPYELTDKAGAASD